MILKLGVEVFFDFVFEHETWACFLALEVIVAVSVGVGFEDDFGFEHGDGFKMVVGMVNGSLIKTIREMDGMFSFRDKDCIDR